METAPSAVTPGEAARGAWAAGTRPESVPGELGHSRFGVPIGQHKRRGAKGTPASLHFLETQCFQQHGLGFGAGRVAPEWDGLIVRKQDPAGVLTGERHDARSQ